MTEPAHARYLRTLQLVPDDVILEMATRDFNMRSADSCLCGWAVREGLAALASLPVDDFRILPTATLYVPAECQRLYGGSLSEWRAIFFDVVDSGHFPAIERAFVERIEQAVERAA